jgi:hypothetical protein
MVENSIMEEDRKESLWLHLMEVEEISHEVQYGLRNLFDLLEQPAIAEILGQITDMKHRAGMNAEEIQEILKTAKFAVTIHNLKPNEIVRGIEREYRLKEGFQKAYRKGRTNKVELYLHHYRYFLKDNYPDEESRESALDSLRTEIIMNLSIRSIYRLKKAVKEKDLPMEPLFGEGFRNKAEWKFG